MMAATAGARVAGRLDPPMQDTDSAFAMTDQAARPPASGGPLVVSAKRHRLSPWFEVVERMVRFQEGQDPQPYHAVGQADYVGVLALTDDDRVPLIRQYRPAIEGYSLELPAGLLEDGETPQACAERELAEETGFGAGRWVALGTLDPDTARLSNRFHGFFALNLKPIDPWTPEPGVETIALPRSEFLDLVLTGRFVHALHIALVGLALASGVLPPR